MKRYAMLLALVVSLLMVQAASAELVDNGGFETGDWPKWALSPLLTPQWTFVSTNPLDAHSGSGSASLGELGGMGYLSQNLTTTPGGLYTLRFWLSNDYAAEPPDYPNSFLVNWNGINISTGTDLGLFSYTEYVFPGLKATALTTELQFGFRNDLGWFHLDDISANQVPIPGAVWLLGSGLVGLAGLRRKFKS
jgi:hypothetical protein